VVVDGATRSVVVDGALADGPDAPRFDAVHSGDIVHLDLAGRSVPFRIAPPPDVDAAARAAVLHGVAGATGPAEVLAPMPGAVLLIHVTVGQAVAAGDPIVTLEAMKMEHVVAATIAGHVGDIRTRPADQVTRGQLLAVIEP
jgi:biotin carboxyl carrier protein